MAYEPHTNLDVYEINNASSLDQVACLGNRRRKTDLEVYSRYQMFGAVNRPCACLFNLFPQWLSDQDTATVGDLFEYTDVKHGLGSRGPGSLLNA